MPGHQKREEVKIEQQKEQDFAQGKGIVPKEGSPQNMEQFKAFFHANNEKPAVKRRAGAPEAKPAKINVKVRNKKKTSARRKRRQSGTTRSG